MGLTTPYEGATIKALLFRRDTSGRYWKFRCQVENNRGTGWKIDGSFYDCGRYVAKSMLRGMALELRRAYTHRGQKIHKRAIARAMAKAEAQDTGRE